MFNIAAGMGAKAHGVFCIAVGDGVTARGAYQVTMGEMLTIDNSMTKELAVATLLELKEMELTFQAMHEQKFVPPEFFPSAIKAMGALKAAIEKHFGDKNVIDLTEDIKALALKNAVLQKENENLKSSINEIKQQLNEKD